jgi:hypothetical protein
MVLTNLGVILRSDSEEIDCVWVAYCHQLNLQAEPGASVLKLFFSTSLKLRTKKLNGLALVGLFSLVVFLQARAEPSLLEPLLLGRASSLTRNYQTRLKSVARSVAVYLICHEHLCRI